MSKFIFDEEYKHISKVTKHAFLLAFGLYKEVFALVSGIPEIGQIMDKWNVDGRGDEYEAMIRATNYRYSSNHIFDFDP